MSIKCKYKRLHITPLHVKTDGFVEKLIETSDDPFEVKYILIVVHLLLCWLFTGLITTHIDANTVSHPVFLSADRSLNPFSDPFIQLVVNMDRNKLHTISQIDDHEFLLQLSRNDDSLGGKCYVRFFSFRATIILYTKKKN